MAVSIAIVLPYRSVSTAAFTFLDIFRNRAKPSPEPFGITPRVLWFLEAILATVLTVPSPPIATKVSNVEISEVSISLMSTKENSVDFGIRSVITFTIEGSNFLPAFLL